MAGPQSVGEVGPPCGERERLKELVEDKDELTARLDFCLFVCLAVVDEGHECEGDRAGQEEG